MMSYYKRYLKLISLGAALSVISGLTQADTKILDTKPLNPNQALSLKDESACIASDKTACPKMLEIALVGTLRAEKTSLKKASNSSSEGNKDLNARLLSSNTLSITNKSRRTITSVIGATHQSTVIKCGQFTIPGRATITAKVSCDVPGTPYTLADIDGRSNTIEVSGPESCADKAVNDECRGGIIFEKDGVKGLIVSKTDIPDNETTRKWGCDGISMGATSETDGQGNTTAIVTGCAETNVAAKSCNDYSVTSGGVLYDKWYLPAKNELNGLYQYALTNQSNAAAIEAGSLTVPNYSAKEYWSSTEDAGSAWNQVFSIGDQNTLFGKGHGDSVRCIQAF